MIILHSAIPEGRLLLWAEAAPETLARLKKRQRKRAVELPPEAAHPYDAGVKGLAEAIGEFGFELSSRDDLDLAWAWLPTSNALPRPSDPVIGEIDGPASPQNPLAPWAVTSLRLSSEEAIEFLATLAERTERIGPDLSCLVTAFRFAASLVSRQQFLPGLAQEGKKYFARWEPVFLGEDAERLTRLAQALPDSCRAVSRGEKGAPDHSPRRELAAFIGALVDHLVRSRNKIERVGKRSNFDSVDAQWLYALRSPDGRLEAKELPQFAERLRSWRRPIALTSSVHFRLCLRLEEPEDEDDENIEKAWTLHFLVQSLDDPSLMLPLAEAGKLRVSGDLPIEEALLAALGQAAGIFPPIGKALAMGLPESCPLDSVEALDFLLDKAWLLKQAGFNLFLPAWWSKKGTKQRLSIKAKVPASFAKGDSIFSSVFDFDWKVALGDQELSAQELKALAKLKVPLVKVRGQWVQVDAKALRAAGELSKKRGEITGRQLLRMALGQAENLPEGVSFGGLSAEGWVGNLLEQLNGNASFEELPPPPGFRGTLRPYQLRGYSWLHFLNRWGIGACLADDMGLGKTIQVLTLVQKEWEENRKQPVLLICPTSVVGNWQREASKFTPDLPVLVHHGAARAKGAKFKEEAKKQAIVISSYALLQRDAELFRKIPWRGVVLDEAQNVKNPETKQAKAARTIEADYRIALTGTPVENHLGELWSILDFLNPGLLGSQAAFKRDFLLPVQVFGDPEATEALKKLTSPFVLRRLKTDRTIIADLPEKLEMKVFCTLTKEQATLYQAVVEEATEALEESEGIKRKGIILATLTKLKQVCNHPAQFLGDRSELSNRSGKLTRLVEMLEECIEVGDHSLLFTQFAEMGEMLKSFLQEAFGQEVLFLHGGVPKNKRDQMVERFQNDPDGPKIFILSLKAGGTGLNLTRANHVFHFDRWWNPAVENQATDRAFRIGQVKNVQVHKFLCPGTLEERIDEMIEKKQKLAEKVVGTGESWLTELSTEALKDLLALRAEALEES